MFSRSARLSGLLAGLLFILLLPLLPAPQAAGAAAPDGRPAPLVPLGATASVAAGSDEHLRLLPLAAYSDCGVFSDSFADSGSGWPVFENEIVKYGYLSGEYQILSKTDQYFFLIRAPVCPKTSYDVRVDARWVGTPGASYGLAFGVAADFSSYYLWQVNTDYREYVLLRRQPSGWTVLAGPCWQRRHQPGQPGESPPGGARRRQYRALCQWPWD